MEPRIVERAAAAASRFSLVIPVYNNEDTIPQLIERIDSMAKEIEGPLEAVFVIDGSPDCSYQVLRTLLTNCAFSARVIQHSRNFGAWAATRTGLAAAEGDYIAVMAADLQEPASLMPDFFRTLIDDDYQVAIGIRSSRTESDGSAVTSRAFWAVYRRWVQPEMPAGGIDVFACTADVRDVLVQMDESHTSLVGLLIWLGYRRAEVAYDRLPRPTGKSGWTFRKKVRYLLDSVYSFTDVPISALLTLGVLGVVVSGTISIVVFVGWAFGAISIPGYTPLMLTLLFGMSVIVSGLGIVGSFVWRTYENSKGRPGSVTMHTETFERQ